MKLETIHVVVFTWSTAQTSATLQTPVKQHPILLQTKTRFCLVIRVGLYHVESNSMMEWSF